MDCCLQFDPLNPRLGWVPAIPLPFMYRGWRTLFRSRPQCVFCETKPIFKTRQEWETHYTRHHAATSER